MSLTVGDDLAVPRVPTDTSAAGAEVAAKPLLMAANGDQRSWDEHSAMRQRRDSLGFELPPLAAEAGGNPSWLFKLTAKPHFLLRVTADLKCAA